MLSLSHSSRRILISIIRLQKNKHTAEFACLPIKEKSKDLCIINEFSIMIMKKRCFSLR